MYIHLLISELPEKRVKRKCEQLENLATAVQEISQPGDIIVDFCSGGVGIKFDCNGLLLTLSHTFLSFSNQEN